MAYAPAMVRGKVIAIGATAFAAVVVVWLTVFRASDDARIREQLAKLAAAVRVTADDAQTNPIGRFAHVNDAFTKLFDRDVRVSIPELTSLDSGRRPLAELATSAPRVFRSFDVDFSDIEVKIDDAKSSALVGATASVSAVEQGNTPRADKRAVDFRFAKQDGEWLITSLTVWPKDEARP